MNRSVAIALLFAVLSWTLGTGDLAPLPLPDPGAATVCPTPEPADDEHRDTAGSAQLDSDAACAPVPRLARAVARLPRAQHLDLPASRIPPVTVPPPTA